MKKRITNIFSLIGLAIALTLAMQADAAAQILISEIEIDPPSTTSDACQYTEIRGTPNSVVPANTYFLSVNSDNGNFGFANQAVNIGGQTVGANGTITLFNSSFGTCANRVYGSGTNLITYFQPLRVGTGSETYLIVQATGTVANGQDLDSNDDGIFNANLGITFLDGFALIVNPEEEYIYGAAAGVVNISNTISLDQPDAATRFTGNTTPFAASAFYYGELAASPDETTQYAAPLSANFPQGGVLTPGDGAAPPAVNTEARADFDGDGRTDLSVFRPSEGNWYLQRSTAGFAAINWGVSSDVLVPGDYDGDNKTDTAVRRGGEWYILKSTNNTLQAISWGLASDIPVADDYDGDNKTDTAVFRASNSTWYISNSAGGTQFTSWGQSGDVPVSGDFDGDNKSDLTVYRNGQWLTRKSLDGGLISTAWGQSGDILVPANYDGDTKDDLAVFRPSNGTWYVLRSTNNTPLFIPFGQSGDVPVPGDYDGDSKDDQAVYRNGIWYLNRSTAGFAASTFGVASDRVIPNEYLP